MGMEKILENDVVITGVSFTIESFEISYLINQEQTELASIARSIEIPVSDEKLVNDYMDLQEFLCDLVHDAKVAIRNPPVRQGGGLKSLYRQRPKDIEGEDFDLVDENGGMDGH